jgi:excisionase family DNA binding protein
MLPDLLTLAETHRHHRPMSALEQHQRFLTLREVAELVRISRTTVYGLARSGELPTVRVGGQIRVSRDALEKWLADSTRRPSG